MDRLFLAYICKLHYLKEIYLETDVQEFNYEMLYCFHAWELPEDIFRLS